MNRLSPIAIALLILAVATVTAGPLDPPGAPASTGLELDEIESRTPISSLPFTISTAGSYIVTGNLSGSSGITISTSNVTIDLLGHSLIATGGSDDGIEASGSVSNITIQNGAIRNWGADGIGMESANNVRVLNVSVLDNDDDGIVLGDESMVINCIADNNADIGIFAEFGSMVIDCVASDNGEHGINVGNRSLVRGCTATQNGFDGIRAFDGGSVIDNVCNDNLDDGIQVRDNCTVRGNSCVSNGTGVTTFNAGIHLEGNRNRIQSNDVTENNDFGIYINGDENLIIQTSAWSNGSNAADNYEDDGTNTRLGIISTSAGTTNPWANWSFFF